MIRLENVNKYFNFHKKNEIHVINNTSLELPDKGLVALLGPSGCGKTTLLNTIGGLDKVKNGKIYVNNYQITKKSAHYIDKIRNLNIGYIFQNYYLIDNKTVYDNVALSLKTIGIKDKGEIKKRVNYVLETLGIYRYRNRPSNMLSGGERQRVGIARAIVKNPSIIIADEPTGNLDSSNTIEIMNIIKSISKERLVLLVTHESDIAKFYSDRIIEIEDGTIKKDYLNKHNDNLDYHMDNKIYLKDFKHITKFENEDNTINIYNDNKNDIKLTIVVKNNNIYIKGSKNNKIEVIDNDSNIEFINDHYKQIDKSIYEKYEFDFENIIDNSKKLRYSSIFNPITLLVNGFKKIMQYSFIKKLLLLGFLASGAFIAYSVSNSFGITKVEDKYFITKNRQYYDVEMSKVKVDKYLAYEKITSVDYLLPGSSEIIFHLVLPNYYQTIDSYVSVGGSLTSINKITKEKLINGRMPQNEYELVVDKMVIKNINDSSTKNVGIIDNKDYLNREIKLNGMKPFKIVGISDCNSPSIYADSSLFIDMLSNSYEENKYYGAEEYVEKRFFDYNLVEDLTLKKGRLPINEYEVIIPSSEEGSYELNKKSSLKINDHKLTVVGIYNSETSENFLVNSNMIKYDLIVNSKNITVMPKNEESIVTDFNKENVDIYLSYNRSLQNYKKSRNDTVTAGLIAAFIILGISFIEIYLMVRASFLSRIKEIGIYRAIGVKKSDIYKMFFGEIFAITTIACVPGILFINYVLYTLSSISYIAENYLVNGFTIIFSIILIYLFNTIVGLLPVMGVVRQTPAQILARKDLE